MRTKVLKSSQLFIKATLLENQNKGILYLFNHTYKIIKHFQKDNVNYYF